MADQINLTTNLKKLQEIAQWFDQQSQVDVEEGLKKVREAASLLKESKSRLQEVELEFKEIQAEMSVGEETDNGKNEQNPSPDDVPF